MKERNKIEHPIILFYLISFLYSWIVWTGGIVMTAGTPSSANLAVSLGGIGSVLGVLFILIRGYDADERREYLSRLTRIQGVPTYIWVSVLLLPVLLTAISNVLALLIVGEPIRYPLLPLNDETLTRGILYLMFLFLFGPLPEEMAWRGVAFHALKRKRIVSAQLIVAFLWALWHLPLFYIRGSYQWSLGVYSMDFWLFFANIVSISFVYGWFYIKGGESILVVILSHYAVNLTGELFVTTPPAAQIQAVLSAMVGILALFDSCRISVERRSY